MRPTLSSHMEKTVLDLTLSHWHYTDMYIVIFFNTCWLLPFFTLIAQSTLSPFTSLSFISLCSTLLLSSSDDCFLQDYHSHSDHYRYDHYISVFINWLLHFQLVIIVIIFISIITIVIVTSTWYVFFYYFTWFCFSTVCVWFCSSEYVKSSSFTYTIHWLFSLFFY